MKKKFKILGLTLSACMAFGLAALASGCSAKDKTDKWFEQLFCEHKYDEGVETQAPTCTEEGLLTYTCTECGKTKKKDIAMIEHTEVEIPSVSPTCTEVGYTDGVKCAVCEEVLQQPKVVAKIPHFEVQNSEAVAATCTTAGLKPGTHCARCDEVITAETVIPALGHLEIPDTAVEATCTTSGLTEGKHCKRCNEVLEAQEEIPATGHTEVTDAAVAATCTTSGKTAGKHCSVCNTVITAQETIPAEHTDENIGENCDICGRLIYDAMDYTPTSLLLNTTTLNNTWFRIRIDESYNDETFYCIFTNATLGFDSVGDKYYGVGVPTKKGLESGKERCVYLFGKGGYYAKVLDGIEFYYSEDGQYVDLCIKEGAVVTAIGEDKKEVSFTVSSDTDGVVEHVGYHICYKNDEFIYGNVITVLKPSENN